MEIGTLLGQCLQPGDFLNLNGDLGAGKTLLVKGIGMGLAISPASITSPTFSIINEYTGKYPLYHFDLYRLEDDLDLEQIGYIEYFYGSGISVVEWGNLFVSHLPEERLDLTMENMGSNERQLTIAGLGARGQELVEQLRGRISCTY